MTILDPGTHREHQWQYGDEAEQSNADMRRAPA
jgi:hypothetical protein